MRTEMRNGLLWFVHGITNGHFLLAQMISGGLLFQYQADGYRGTLIMPNDTVSICDGKWHDLVFNHWNRQLRILVDRTHTVTTGSLAEKVAMYVDSVYYFGGIPRNSNAEKFIKASNIKNIQPSKYIFCLD